LGGVAGRSQLRRLGERVAVPREELAGDVADVVALVAVLGKGAVPPEELEVAGANRAREDRHLAARVVEVVLALSGPAGGGEEPDERLGVGPRRTALRTGQDERRIGREVAPLRVARHLDRERGHRRRAELPRVDRVAQRPPDERLNVPLQAGPPRAKDSARTP